AVDFAQIGSDFLTAHERVMRGIGGLAVEQWTELAPYSPGNNPNETLGSLLHLIAFHQAYHVGQLGLGRRLVGKAGAIK
ncbi:MAG: DinB family protein, partial [Thermoanaerobaculia bacterium]